MGARRYSAADAELRAATAGLGPDGEQPQATAFAGAGITASGRADDLATAGCANRSPERRTGGGGVEGAGGLDAAMQKPPRARRASRAQKFVSGIRRKLSTSNAGAAGASQDVDGKDES